MEPFGLIAAHWVLNAIGTVIAAMLWKLIRLFSVFRDFPPHVHDNGNIRYPKGFEPGKIQSLFPKSHGASE